MCGTCQNLGGVLSSDDTTDAGLKSPPSLWPAACTDHPPLPSPPVRCPQLGPTEGGQGEEGEGESSFVTSCPQGAQCFICS